MSPALLFEDPLALRLFLEIRLPRVAAALLVGGSLATAGCVLQMLFANPLVEPGLIGVSQGASFGAALSIIVLAPPLWATQLFAALFGFVGLALAYAAARRIRFGGWILRLVLSGIVVSALFSAGVGLLKFVADPFRELPELTFWLLGGLSATDWARTAQVAPFMTVGLLYMLASRWRLNLLSLDDRVSFSLGAAPSRERLALLIAATVATGASISISGIVAWVGLLVPHAARRIAGADGRRVVPLSMVMGAAFTVVCDTVARTIVVGEIPLGIVTSLLGATGFLLLLLTRGVRVER